MARMKLCGNASCSNRVPSSVVYCGEHTPQAWAGSDRRRRLPPGWRTIRAHVLQRDPICRDASGCTSPSTDVDHIHAGDDDALSNLQGLCRRHHLAKSGREGATARHLLTRDDSDYGNGPTAHRRRAATKATKPTDDVWIPTTIQTRPRY